MMQIILSVELLLLGFTLYFTRDWELRLIRGERLSPGRVAVYLRFMRPQHYVIFSTLLVFVAYPGFHDALVFVLPVTFFQQAFLFAANDYYDRDVDALNTLKKQRNVVSSGELSLSRGRAFLVALFVLTTLLSVPLGGAATLLTLAFLAAGFMYSAPPYRLKGRRYWDLVSHCFLVLSFPFLFTTVVLGLFTVRNLTMYLAFVLLSLYIQVSQELRDVDDDATIETNTVLTMGYKYAYLLMGLLLTLGFLLSFWLVFTQRASSLFLLLASLCAFCMYDLYRTWKSGQYGACFQNTWLWFNKKAVVGFGPVLLWWLLHL